MKLPHGQLLASALKGSAYGPGAADFAKDKAEKNDAFAEIFAKLHASEATQTLKDAGKPETARAERCSSAEDTPAPRAERCQRHDSTHKARKSEESRDRDDEDDTQDDVQADASKKCDDTSASEHKCEKTEDKNEKAESASDSNKDEGCSVAQAAQEPSAQDEPAAEAADAGDIVAQDIAEPLTEGCEQPQADNSSTVPLSAQQAQGETTKEKTASSTAPQEEKTVTQPPAKPEEVLKTVSFRQDPADHHDKAGHTKSEKHTSNDGSGVATTTPPAHDAVKDDAQTQNSSARQDNLGQHIKAALQEARNADTASDARMSEVVREARDEFKAQRAEAVSKHDDKLALLKGTGDGSEPSSTLSHPAAGSRAISMADKAIGSPAPAPTGSPGGGPPSATGEGAVANLHGPVASEAAGLAMGDKVTFAGYVKAAKDAGLAPHTLPAEQVAVHITRMAKTGKDSFELQLHPAELGRVDIRLDVAKDGLVRAVITADNQAALDALQKDSRTLEKALEQVGLQADSNSLSFNLRERQEQAQQQDAARQRFAQSRWANAPSDEDDIKNTGMVAFSTAPGRVDLRV